MSVATAKGVWPLAEAEKWAEHVRRELASCCERIDVAGSVRRRREQVGDVDLVLLPKPGQRPVIEARLAASANRRILKNGPQILALVLHTGLQVDLYFAQPPVADLLGTTPGNYGMRLLAMTGSKEHNVKLAKLAKARGVHFHPYKGLMRGGAYVATGAGESQVYEGGEVFAGETEQEIFQSLGLPFIKPEDREA